MQLGLSEPPHTWAILPPDLNISRHVEVLMSVDSTIYTVDNLESVDQRLSRGARRAGPDAGRPHPRRSLDHQLVARVRALARDAGRADHAAGVQGPCWLMASLR